MKNILALVLVLCSSQAFATKARLKALSNSFHLTDTQTQFTSPYHMFSVKDFVSFESGITASTTVEDGAEALVKFSLNDTSKMLIAIGHKDEAAQSQRKFMNTVASTTFVTQQNPVEILYAAKTDSTIWAGGVYFSNFKDKVADNSESSTGLRLSASHGDFKWKVNLGLTNKVQNVTNGTLNNQPYANIGLRYSMDNNKFGLDFTNWNAKRDDASGIESNSHSYENIKFQYVKTYANDGEDFFVGIAVDSISLKDKMANKKLSRLAIPLWMGIETQATDWLVLRGSIKQTLFAQSKDEKGYPVGTVDGAFGVVDSDMVAEPNNTEVAMGAGFKFQQVILDGTLKALTGKTATQQLNSTDFIALAGLTYNF